MTDERMSDRLWEAVGRLPTRSGIVFRHYSLAADDREKLAIQMAGIAASRGLALAVAGNADLARRVGAQLVHNPDIPPADLPVSRSVHNEDEAVAARAEGAALVFVSPVHATRSHAGSRPLGSEFAARIAAEAGAPAIALGGMNANNFVPLAKRGFYGWAGIDAWLES